MKINDRTGVLYDISAYNFEESHKLRKAVPEDDVDAALKKVEEAKSANLNATLRMMDRHNEMVKKSQELYEKKARQRAIERQNRERQDDHTALLTEMAIRNAERSDFLNAARLREQDR